MTVSLLFLERPEEPVAVTFAPDDRARYCEIRLTTALDGLVRGDFTEREGPWCAACEAAESLSGARALVRDGVTYPSAGRSAAW